MFLFFSFAYVDAGIGIFVPLGSSLPQSFVYMGKEERGLFRTVKEKNPAYERH